MIYENETIRTMYCCRKLVNESLPFQFAERVHFFLFEKLIDAAQMFGYPFVAKLINLADQSVQDADLFRTKEFYT